MNIRNKKIYISDNANDLYYDLVNDLYNLGEDVGETRELENVEIILTNPRNNIVSLTSRKPSYKYLLAENVWYASGDNTVEFIGHFASMWNRLTDDGVTNNSAYGHIIKKKFGFDQINKVIEVLMKDPTSRRAIININIPNENVFETKDEECTMYLQFLIRDGKLNMTANMRSNDIIYGFTNDIAAFTAIQIFVADQLGIEVGTYTHFDVSLHYYNRNIKMIEEIISNKETVVEPYKIDWLQLYKVCRTSVRVLEEIRKDKDNIEKICHKYGIIK